MMIDFKSGVYINADNYSFSWLLFFQGKNIETVNFKDCNGNPFFVLIDKAQKFVFAEYQVSAEDFFKPENNSECWISWENEFQQLKKGNACE